MAKTKNKSYSTIVAEAEKKNTEVVCCRNCFWANLIRYGANPLLAECTKKPNTGNARFPYEVMVASTKWVCPQWEYQAESEKTVQVRIVRSAA